MSGTENDTVQQFKQAADDHIKYEKTKSQANLVASGIFAIGAIAAIYDVPYLPGLCLASGSSYIGLGYLLSHLSKSEKRYEAAAHNLT